MGEDQVDVRIDQELVLENRAGVLGLPLHRRVGDDLHVRRLGGHALLEALLDVEGVVVAGVAQDLQHRASGLAVALGQKTDRLAGGDQADLDRAGDRGQRERGAADLAVVVQHRNAGGARLLDARDDRVEIDRVHDDRIGLQLDHVLQLIELEVGPVLGIERDHLVAHLAEHALDRLLALGLELVQQRRDHVVDGALVLGRRRLPRGQRQRRGAEPERAAPRYSGHRSLVIVLPPLRSVGHAAIKRGAAPRINRLSDERSGASRAKGKPQAIHAVALRSSGLTHRSRRVAPPGAPPRSPRTTAAPVPRPLAGANWA